MHEVVWFAAFRHVSSYARSDALSAAPTEQNHIDHMNKLRKPPHHAPSSSSPSKHLTQHGSVIPSSAVSESRTMMYARAPIVSPPSKKAMVTTVKSLTATSASEQYWAARALTAETLLSARLAHQSEMAQAIETAEEKRAVNLVPRGFHCTVLMSDGFAA